MWIITLVEFLSRVEAVVRKRCLFGSYRYVFLGLALRQAKEEDRQFSYATGHGLGGLLCSYLRFPHVIARLF